MRGMRGIYKNNTHARPDDTPTSDCMPVTESRFLNHPKERPV